MAAGEGDDLRRRHRLEAGGADLARDLGIDLDAFGVGSNLHWVATLMKLHFERAPLRQVDLTMSDFVTLWSLRVAGGELMAGEVATEVGLPPSSFTAVAKRLERRGLLSRRRSTQDGRSVLVALTGEGAALAERAFRLVNTESARMTRRLDQADRRRLAEMLRLLADELGEMTDSGPDGG
jgi:DNA-binding MarR family transcriptional regulator